MKQQPDKFFQEKLKDYTRPAPAAAWDRIDASLEKKTFAEFAWLKIAAAVLLLASIGYFFWDYNTASSKQQLADTKIVEDVSTEDLPQPSETNTTVKKESTKKKDFYKTPDAEDPKLAEKEHARKNSEAQKILGTLAANEKKSYLHAEEPSLPLIEPTTTNDNVTAADNTDTHSVASSKPSSRTLTFSVEETNQYLDKKSLAEATSDEKKSSTFKKLLQKAGDLKTNQDPFGDLREKKNEILALNFKNEKRGQNK